MVCLDSATVFNLALDTFDDSIQFENTLLAQFGLSVSGSVDKECSLAPAVAIQRVHGSSTHVVMQVLSISMMFTNLEYQENLE